MFKTPGGNAKLISKLPACDFRDKYASRILAVKVSNGNGGQ